MGLALLVLLFKLRGEDAQARFWVRVLGINFAIGVVTGIPMEFQFGTNWSSALGSPATSSSSPTPSCSIPKATSS